MHVIEDKLYFEKKNDLVIGQAYQLIVDDVVIDRRESKFRCSSINFKKSILPDLIKLGFNKINDNVNQIRLTRVRQNLNENINILEFLNSYRVI